MLVWGLKNWLDDLPKALNKRSVCWQQDLGYSKPQGFSQFLIRYNPLRLLRVKLFKLNIERLKPVKEKKKGIKYLSLLSYVILQNS
jgi:hypothetical protein